MRFKIRGKRQLPDNFSSTSLAFERNYAVLRARMMNLIVFTMAVFAFAALLSSIPYLLLGGAGAFLKALLRAALGVYSAMGILFFFYFMLKMFSMKNRKFAIIRLNFPVFGKIIKNIGLFNLSGKVGLSIEGEIDTQSALEEAITELKDTFIMLLYSLHLDQEREKIQLGKRDRDQRAVLNSLEEYFIFHQTMSPLKIDEIIAYNKNANRKSFDWLLAYFARLKAVIFIASIVFIFCRIALIIYIYRLRFGE